MANISVKTSSAKQTTCTNSLLSTPARTHFITGLKSRVLKLSFLTLKEGEKWSRIFYFEIHRAHSELLLPSAKICPERLNWPGRLAGIFEGARWISKKKSRSFFTIIFKLKKRYRVSHGKVCKVILLW